jgi:hypothetical protein
MWLIWLILMHIPMLCWSFQIRQLELESLRKGTMMILPMLLLVLCSMYILKYTYLGLPQIDMLLSTTDSASANY